MRNATRDAMIASLYPALTQREIAKLYGLTQAAISLILRAQGVTGRTPSLADRLWSKVQKSDGCWEWTGGRNVNGLYGRIWNGSERYMVHRLAYELLVGPIPDGLTLDHLCQNTLCVNPAHLEPVTLAENTSRAAKRVLCSAGHGYTAENTYYHAGRRHCRACVNRRGREYRAEKFAQWSKLPGEDAPLPERRPYRPAA